jgi:ribonucleoside-diphosphate reductase alpha chain
VLGRAARIQQGSGGVGVHFSKLRPRGAPIRRAGGVSPGPVAFVELFAHSARINSLSGRRAGAHLGVLRDDHPDLLEFVRGADARRDALAGVGLAVGVSDALLDAARRGGAWTLQGPGVASTSLAARDVLDDLARAALASGNPTLLFLDAIAAANPAPHLGRIEATNPCGEQPLLPGESCVLGSLHLPALADGRGEPDWGALDRAVADAVRFLDDVVEVQADPDPACGAASRRTRKIGLGVMGFADLLLLRGVPYDAPEAEAFTDLLMRRVSDGAARASEALAEERGAYPAWRGVGPPRRNATALAVAPTGTLRLLAGCSGGLEPFLEPVVRVRQGERELRAVDRTLLRWLAERTQDPRAVVDALGAGVPAAGLPGLDPADRRLLRRAPELAPDAQIALQAAFQRHVDGAVSKTVHVPADAGAADVVAWIALARRRGCKGVAFYRARGPGAAPCVRCGDLAPD